MTTLDKTRNDISVYELLDGSDSLTRYYNRCWFGSRFFKPKHCVREMLAYSRNRNFDPDKRRN